MNDALTMAELNTLFYLVSTSYYIKEVASIMSVSQKTVKFHITRIYRKLGCVNRAALLKKHFAGELPQYVYRFLKQREVEEQKRMSKTLPKDGLPTGFAKDELESFLNKLSLLENQIRELRYSCGVMPERKS